VATFWFRFGVDIAVAVAEVAHMAGEVEAEFRQFVAARSASLQRTAYLLVGDWAHAEDVVQTALTKTYLAWKRLGQIEAVDAYARRVLVTTATSWWRRRWHGERPTDVMPERAGPDRFDQELERQAMWRQVQSLPARQRAVLVLRFYEDLTEAETARVLGVAVGTVKSQTARALASLRSRLVQSGVEPAGTAVPPSRSSARPDPASPGPSAVGEAMSSPSIVDGGS
jgi:RNA polymerase sigma-70 factor (sigma-E family)